MIWQEERAKLKEIKNIKSQLEQAKIELESAQRPGNFTRASELRYGIIPELEKQLPHDGEEESSESLLHERVIAYDTGIIVSRITGIRFTSCFEVKGINYYIWKKIFYDVL
ncbi:P-loop containing nucleoside triphosphate hydrolase protein [Gigaspora margarita]|uniref:P-loop containing nucleoside triphosphate hydrolase protein n=1 Tax=Gigaspora margarita TaxID=4874 RepID=A0A8H4A9N4_GIGMA|nr:P-loop containing nucleoside triphosphate hydrolase protein [Gigaspora margarita]